MTLIIVLLLIQVPNLNKSLQTPIGLAITIDPPKDENASQVFWWWKEIDYLVIYTRAGFRGPPKIIYGSVKEKLTPL